MSSIKEFLYLTFKVFPEVLWFTYQEERKVRKLFYSLDHFKKVDRFFRRLYYFKSSYSIYKKYMKKNGLSSIYTYGETPLTVFQEMFLKSSLTSNDCFIDLGCGRGRGLFLASSVWGCKALGIERVSAFCEKGNQVAKLLSTQTKLVCGDIISFDLSKGTFFYFYAICMDEEELNLSIKHLENVSEGSKIVTVSFPLTEYSHSFSVISSWESRFPWGSSEVFLHLKKS
jgi:SAM-dependent methyltransferase